MISVGIEEIQTRRHLQMELVSPSGRQAQLSSYYLYMCIYLKYTHLFIAYTHLLLLSKIKREEIIDPIKNIRIINVYIFAEIKFDSFFHSHSFHVFYCFKNIQKINKFVLLCLFQLHS